MTQAGGGPWPGFDPRSPPRCGLRRTRWGWWSCGHGTRFDFTRSPLHWITGEPFASHAISGLNLILPLAERGFVAMFRRALPYAADPEIREQMVGFMGQESMHVETHDQALWEF
jgi:predicted metal-dependent hydrolase